MKKENSLIIFVVIFFVSASYVLFLSVKETNMYPDSKEYPDNETLTVLFSDLKQVPWSTVNTYTYELETFGNAVFGALTELNESGIEFTSNKDVLLKDYSCDNYECKATLKQDIYFHNGREVNAYDVEFSLLRDLLTYKNDTFSYSILDDVHGIKEFYEKRPHVDFWKEVNGIKYPSGYIDGIKVVDNYHLIIHLKNINKFFFQLISTSFLPIIPLEEMDNNYKDWKKYPVGFGRYKVIKSDLKNYEFVLEKNNKDDSITRYVRILFDSKNTNVDIRLANQGSQFDEETEDFNNYPSPYCNGGFLFNYTTQLGADENFRKAINLALDRNKIANTAKFNEIQPENQLMPDSGWHRSYRAQIPVSTQNIEKAKYYLNLVPREMWENKIFLVHTFWTANKNLSETPYFIEMKKELAQIGLKIEFCETDMKYTRFKSIDSNVLWWTGFDFLTEQPNANFAYFQNGSFFQHIYPDDPKFKRLYALSLKTLNESYDDTKKLSEYFTNKNIMVVVFNLVNTYVYKKSRISSFGNQKSGIKLLLTEIRLKN